MKYYSLRILFCGILIPGCYSFLTKRIPFRSHDILILSFSRQDDYSLPAPDNDNSDSLDRHLVEWDMRNLLCSDKLLATELYDIYQAVQKNSHPTKKEPMRTEDLPDSPELQKVRSFLKTYSNDFQHAGRFGIDEHYSLQSNLVFAMDHPLEYLQSISTKQSSRNNNNNNNEVVVFCPDHNVDFQQATRQQQYLASVLDGMELSLLHPGMQTPAEVPLTADTVLALRSVGVFQDSTEASPIVDGLYSLDPNLLRAAVAWQSGAHELHDLFLETIIKLIDVAVESIRNNKKDDKRTLVLMAYSVTARAVGAALSQWKQQATTTTPHLRNHGLSLEQAERLLKQAITVVTINGLCPVFPKGPAYIHVSMMDDPLAVELGASGGDDAVLLKTLSPYAQSSHAHNPQAAAIQFLSLVMKRNGLQSIRQLYEAGSQPTPQLDIAPTLFAINYYQNKVGKLDLPCDELLTSMIQATGGDRWLESPLEEDDEDCLPDATWAEATIGQHFGYGVYEEIVEACQAVELS